MGKLAVIRKGTRKAWNSKYGQKFRKEYLPKLEAKARDALMDSIEKFKERRALRRTPQGSSGYRSAIQSVGENVGHGVLKRFDVLSDNDIFNWNRFQLHSKILTTIPKQTAAEEINYRSGQVINISGFDIQWVFTNVTADIRIVNIAMVVPKHLALTDIAIPPERFLRGSETVRELDFSGALGSNTLNNRAINTDLYDIIFRDKFMLGANSGDGQTTGKYQKYYKKWVKINRQFRYGAEGYTQGDDPFLVWWCDSHNRTGGQTQDPQLGINIDRSIVVFFRDVMC